MVRVGLNVQRMGQQCNYKCNRCNYMQVFKKYIYVLVVYKYICEYMYTHISLIPIQKISYSVEVVVFAYCAMEEHGVKQTYKNH